MAISDRLIEKRRWKNVIVMQGDQTLQDAINELERLWEWQPGATEWNTFLIVAESATQYRTTLFCRLPEYLGELTAAVLELPLSHHAIPAPNEVIPRDTPEAGGSVETRLKNTPGAIFVIVDSNGFVCAFANMNLSGGSANGTLASLFRNGRTVKLVCAATSNSHRHKYSKADFGAANTCACKESGCGFFVSRP